MSKKRYKFFIFSFFLLCPVFLLNLFSQDVSSLKIGQSNFSIDNIKKITLASLNINLFFKDGSNSRVFLEQPCYFIHPVSIPEPDANSLAINYYPNPVIDMLFLSDSENLGEICIYDIQGKLLKRHQTESTTVSLDLSDLKSGMYLVKTAVHSFKIIKK